MKEQIDLILRDCAQRPGPLLIVLHAVQHAFGYVPDEAVPLIADGLNLSRAEVHGVLSFYHHFRRAPPGRHVIQLCRAESCAAMHGDRLANHVQQHLNIGFHETTPDGRFTLEPVFCLGNCACSPAMMIDDELYGRVSTDRFDAVIAARQDER